MIFDMSKIKKIERDGNLFTMTVQLDSQTEKWYYETTDGKTFVMVNRDGR